jgi:hypothetical protein
MGAHDCILQHDSQLILTRACKEWPLRSNSDRQAATAHDQVPENSQTSLSEASSRTAPALIQAISTPEKTQTGIRSWVDFTSLPIEKIQSWLESQQARFAHALLQTRGPWVNSSTLVHMRANPCCWVNCLPESTRVPVESARAFRNGQVQFERRIACDFLNSESRATYHHGAVRVPRI